MRVITCLKSGTWVLLRVAVVVKKRERGASTKGLGQSRKGIKKFGTGRDVFWGGYTQGTMKGA